MTDKTQNPAFSKVNIPLQHIKQIVKIMYNIHTKNLKSPLRSLLKRHGHKELGAWHHKCIRSGNMDSGTTITIVWSRYI